MYLPRIVNNKFSTRDIELYPLLGSRVGINLLKASSDSQKTGNLRNICRWMRMFGRQRFVGDANVQVFGYFGLQDDIVFVGGQIIWKYREYRLLVKAIWLLRSFLTSQCPNEYLRKGLKTISRHYLLHMVWDGFRTLSFFLAFTSKV